MKKCCRCGIEKEATFEFFGHDKRRPDGMHSGCRACSKISNERSYYKHRESRLENVAVYRDKNREKIRQWFEEYNQTPERIKYIQTWNAKTAKRRSVLHKEWRKDNLDKRLATYKKRLMAEKQRTPKWLTKDHLAQIRKFKWIARSLTKGTGIKFDIDHIIPLQNKNVSGLNVPWNIQVLTAKDNQRKKSKFDGTYANESWRNR